MAIDYAKLMAMRIPETEQAYTECDSMLYALETGMDQNSGGMPA